MNVLVVDITGRNAPQYNPALCNNLADVLPKGSHITLMSNNCVADEMKFSFRKLMNLVPKSLLKSTSCTKRILRLLDVCINYCYLIFYCMFSKLDILHIQWLTLIEYCSVEYYILGLIRYLSPKTKIVLTVHNIVPHDYTDEQKQVYLQRFCMIGKYINKYIVHLHSSKQELNHVYNIPFEQINVAYHGIYMPENYVPICLKSDSRFCIIMYGSQESYKGTDLLIEALKLLPQKYLSKLSTKIMGRTSKELYEKYAPQCKDLNVEWINQFVDDSILYKCIDEASLILLPYRKISQSGVLLLALSYKKPILTSDLPSFKETLEGFTEDMFFKSGDAESLANSLMAFLDKKIDCSKEVLIINKLVEKYSWRNTAISTLDAYMN